MAGVYSGSNAETLQAIMAQLTHVFRPGFIETLNEGAVLWNKFPKVRGRGALIEQKYHVGRNSGAGWNTETGSIGAGGSQTYISGYADWYIAQTPIQITDKALNIAQGAGHSGYDMWLDETRRSANDMRQLIEKALWSASTSNACLGIQDAVNDGSDDATTYMGITYSENPMLRSQYVPYGNHSDIEKAMDALERLIVHGSGSDITGTSNSFASDDQGGGKVDVWFTTPTVEAKLKDTLITNNRWVYTDQARGPVEFSLGVRRMEGTPMVVHNGVPVIASRFCPSGCIYGLDMTTWELQVLPQRIVDGTGMATESDFVLKALGRQGSYVKVYWEIMMNLICTLPHRNGLIDGVS